MAEENTMQELFQTDPEKLTKDNIKEIIEHFRKHRTLFELGGKPVKKDTKKKVEGKIDLSQLGI